MLGHGAWGGISIEAHTRLLVLAVRVSGLGLHM